MKTIGACMYVCKNNNGCNYYLNIILCMPMQEINIFIGIFSVNNQYCSKTAS